MEMLEFVDVYFNLHKRVWSCKCRKTGRVLRHARAIMAPYGGQAVVQAAGRERVLRDKVKNVHAYIRLDMCETETNPDTWAEWVETLPNLVEISYNPYKAGHFYRKDTHAAVNHLRSVLLMAPEYAAPRVWAVV